MTPSDANRHSRWLDAFNRENTIATLEQARAFAIVASCAAIGTATTASLVVSTRWVAVITVWCVEVVAAVVFWTVWWRMRRRIMGKR